MPITTARSEETEILEKLKRGYLEMLILKLLSERDMYTYELKTEIFNRSGGNLSPVEGILYPPIYRMMQKGYLSEGEKVEVSRHIRVYYHLEPAGEAYLKMWTDEYRKTTAGIQRILKGGQKDE